MKADECDSCRQEIVSVLAHELRTPLAAIGNSLYVLKWSQPGGEKAQRAMAVIERQIGRLSTLITSLTDAARINRGKVELRRSTLDLCEVVRSTACEHEDLFRAHDIELSLNLPSLPVLVSADPLRLGEILANLLDNAARFTPPGGRVSLALYTNQDLRRVRIRVQDTGIGLDPRVRMRLFEPFIHADTSHARTRGGLGLGLALVKGLVELHGGSVRGESDGPGRGSVFTVELPLAGEVVSSSRPAAAGSEG